MKEIGVIPEIMYAGGAISKVINVLSVLGLGAIIVRIWDI